MRVLRFTTSWCQPCIQLARILKEIETPVYIEVIDIDNQPEVAAEYGIRTVPTMVLLDGNTEVKRMSGIKSKQELESWLNG